MQAWTMRGRVTQTSLFVVTLAIGVVSIGIAKWLVGLYFVFGIAVPTLLMLAYAVLNIRDGFLDSTRSQVADNCYFLGFLYFLTSLAITLAQVSSGVGPDARIEVGSIIRGFGVALVTTITGLFLRILLLQNIAGLSSAREKAEEGLLVAVNRFRETVTMAVDLLVQVRDQVINASRTTSEVTNEALRAVADNARQTTEVATAAYVTALSAAAERTTVGLSTIVTDLRAKVTGLELPSDALTAQLQPALNSLREALISLNGNIMGLAAGVGESSEQIGRVAPRLERLFAGIADHAQALEQALNRLNGQAGAVGELGDQLFATVERARRLTEEIDRTLVSLRGAPAAAQGAMDAVAQVAAAAAELRQTLGAVAATLDQDLGTVNGSIQQARVAADAMVADTRTAAADVAASVRTLGQAVDAVQQGLNRSGT